MLPSTSLSSCINRSLSSPDMQPEKRNGHHRGGTGCVPYQKSLDFCGTLGCDETNLDQTAVKSQGRDQKNGALLKGASKMISYKKRISLSSIHSDSKGHLLHNVGKTLQRTHSHLKRTRLLHVFYLLALPVYTTFGAFVFQALDGEHDDIMKHFYDNRCQGDRHARLHQLEEICSKSGAECYSQMTNFLLEVETCYQCKQLVVSDEETKLKGTDFSDLQKTRTTVAILVDNESRDGKTRKTSRNSIAVDNNKYCSSSAEQKRVFICGVTVFVLYLLAVSGVFAYTTEWDFFTAFYFLFNSVALIGFGDVFPSQPRIILVNMIFIILGVVLFSMCYFILQEEIREKAFEASRKARMSISKYSHTIMQHTKTQWSRRNSPAFDGAGSSPEEPTSFERLKKRRQSAPAVSLNVPLDLKLCT
ncbi:hypothetical protein QR680_001932 [Steinernema hermaphroditum]|uniref:Potassium channel domain-containing protein n=1 Tax=Steinernema hermaphroditum TaxID=289476 RepID=A0AA39H0I1_9BILA|nr:hypothetical protein QR680_001932 [Steinernema hermaphroditum]